MKAILGKIFGLLFKIFKFHPINEEKITFIMTHDDKFNGNLKYIYEEIIKQYPNFKINIINRGDYSVNEIKKLSDIFKFTNKVIILYIKKNYHLATSKYVFLNNIFITAAYLKFKKEVKVIQVWHAIGTFKKFGEEYKPSVKIDRLQKRANSIYTDVLVCSQKDIPVYAKAFNVSEKKVKALGSPVCDLFNDKIRVKKVKDKILNIYPLILNKKVYLYAPTFRDNESDNVKILEYVDYISKNINEDSILMLRLHPHIYKNCKYKIKNNNIIDVSNYDDVNELMLVSDVLITDYSSLFYEFTFLEKSILFFAFDLDAYEKERGFYFEYEEYVPGKIIKSVNELVDSMNSNDINNLSIKFKHNYYDVLNTNVTENIIQTYFD